MSLILCLVSCQILAFVSTYDSSMKYMEGSVIKEDQQQHHQTKVCPTASEHNISVFCVSVTIEFEPQQLKSVDTFLYHDSVFSCFLITVDHSRHQNISCIVDEDNLYAQSIEHCVSTLELNLLTNVTKQK